MRELQKRTKMSSKTITNPFSELFLEKWQMWKDYKKVECHFEYKGLYSEQAALMELVNLSDGDEETAIKIILQSLANQWKGFWPIKKPTSNGKSKQKTGTTDGSKSGTKVVSIRGGVQEAIDKRNREQQQGGNQYGSKAV